MRIGQNAMLKFPSGATRSAESGRPDYEGFYSPIVIHRFGQYMNKHRVQADGTLRDSDNWQKGMDKRRYVKSLLRHVLDLWLHEREFSKLATEDIEEALCAILFNTQGYLFELLKRRYSVS